MMLYLKALKMTVEVVEKVDQRYLVRRMLKRSSKPLESYSRERKAKKRRKRAKIKK